MDRKTAIYPLLDGKDYTFSERNREDVNYTSLQNKYREHRIKELKRLFPDPIDLELRDSLIYNEFGKMYIKEEVFAFVEDDADSRLNLVYSSFKVKNPQISLEQFKLLVDDAMVVKLLKCIIELEQDDPALDDEVCRELKIKKNLLLEWKKEHPEIYWLVKIELKKKMAQRSVKK